MPQFLYINLLVEFIWLKFIETHLEFQISPIISLVMATTKY